MKALDDALIPKLAKRKEDRLLRTLKVSSGLADFFSNDYLGLARSETLAGRIRDKIDALRPVMNGSTGSRLLSGNSQYHEDVENSLANIFRSEAAVIFNSGYTANLSVLSSLPQREDTILYDELSHASIKDGARLSLAKRFSFLHNDLNDLEQKLKKARGRIFIAVESIYSMDGDTCRLQDLVKLANEYSAFIILDEAHSTGTYGWDGSGMAVAENLAPMIPLRVYTFGKAMGIHGACVATSAVVKDHLVNFARPFIYTTAPDNHSLASIECSFQYLKENIHLQEQLRGKIDLFRNETKTIAGIGSVHGPIQTMIIPGNENVTRAASKLQQTGFDVRPILSPTVQKGKERLRICIHVYNTDDTIRDLAAQLADLPAVNQQS